MGGERQPGGWMLAALRRPYLSWAPCAVLTAFSSAWFLLGFAGPPGPAVVAWVPGVAASALAALAGWVTGRTPGVAPAARRFWLQMALGTLLVGTGSVIRGWHALDSTARRVEPPEMVVFLLAILVDAWAMLSLPLGLRRRGELRTFLLDVCTVLAAAALFLWQFSVRDALEHGYDNRYALIAALMSMVLALVAVFALVKVALTGTSTVDPVALRWLGLALVVGCVGSMPETMLPPSAPSLVQVVVPLCCTLAIVAMDRQRRAVPATVRPAGTTMRQRFSILPYLAIAASNVLLLVTAVTGTRVDRIGVAAGVVVLAGLVIARQVFAFDANNRLLEQLDAGMVELRDRERRFRSLVQNASDLITVTGAGGQLSYVSPGALRLLGVPAERWLGRPSAELVHPDDLAVARDAFLRITDTPGATTTCQLRLANADGTYWWAETIMANLLHDPVVAGIVGNARDITEARELQQRLRHQASHDSLTQLANRALFNERVDQALATGPVETVGVLLIDLNEFKVVNDTLGHAVGDALLVAAASRLAGVVGPNGTVARLGGDEFAVLVDADQTDRLVAAIAEAFAEPTYVDGHRLTIAASIGVATGTADATPAELLRRADVAMYVSKADRSGTPTRYARYRPSLDPSAGLPAQRAA
jgi:diguanylate cyclase (GGDEF)-like protein/PAS domain S-box-containing protein